MKWKIYRGLLPVILTLLLALALPAGAYALEEQTESGTPSASEPSEPSPEPTQEPGSDPQPTSNLVITSYQTLDANGKSLSKLEKGGKVTLLFKLKDSGIKTSEAITESEKDLDLSRLVDSFSGGEKVKLKILSKGEEPLEVQAEFPGLTYSGAGKEFRFQMGYRRLDIPYNTQSLNVAECQEYTEPAPDPMPDIPSVDPTPAPAVSTPNLIVQSYSYGGGQIATGSTFNLDLTVLNTSKTMKVENIIMSLETDEGLSITSSSNSFHFDELAPGKTFSQQLEMLAIDTEKVTSPGITIHFKYEYIGNDERKAVDTSEKISIPVYQPVRFEVSAPEVPTEAPAGSELTLSLPYVNKGKGIIYNVAATIDGSIKALAPTQNLGNFEAGKSGSIDFILTPEEPGEVELNIKVTYENATGQPQEMDFPIILTIGQPAEWPGFDDNFMPDGDDFTVEEGGFPLIPVILGGTVVILAVAVIILKKLRGRRKKAAHAAWEDPFADSHWEDSNETR